MIGDGLGQQFELHSKCDGKPLKDFKQEINRI